jgi:hypothetical protein
MRGGAVVRPVLAGVATLLLLACAGEEPPFATVAQPVTGGVESGPEDDATVQLHTPSKGCTGVLVAANLVLTARHCLAISERKDEICASDGTSTDDQLLTIVDYAPKDILIHVGSQSYNENATDNQVAAYAKRIFLTNGNTFCRNDIALLVLDRDLEGIEPVPMRIFSGVKRTELMSVIGYGRTSSSGEEGRHRRDGVEVLDVGRSEYSSAASAQVDRTFALGPSACEGDSGGPALAESGAVVGVFSMYSGDCSLPTARNTFTQVAPYADLVFDAFDEAGAEPWFEGEPAPGEEPRRSSGCSVTPLRGSASLGEFGGLVLLGLVVRRRFRNPAGRV